jgi:hypothetical protein
MSTTTTTEEIIQCEIAPEVLFELPTLNGKQSGTVKINPREVFKAAEDSAEFFDHLRAHYRETRRTPVEIACEVRLQLNDGTLFDSGKAMLKNVSPSGALVANLLLSKGCLPMSTFKVVLILKDGEYNGIGIEATPVRLATEASGLGVKFNEIFVTV